MSQLVRLEGKHTAQRAHCELLRPGTLHNEPQYALTPVPPVNKFTWRNEPKHTQKGGGCYRVIILHMSTIHPHIGYSEDLFTSVYNCSSATYRIIIV